MEYSYVMRMDERLPIGMGKFLSWSDNASAQRKRYLLSLERDFLITHGSSWSEKLAALEQINSRQEHL